MLLSLYLHKNIEALILERVWEIIYKLLYDVELRFANLKYLCSIRENNYIHKFHR